MVCKDFPGGMPGSGLEAAKSRLHEPLEPDVCLYSEHGLSTLVFDCVTETQSYCFCGGFAVRRENFTASSRR